MDVIHMFNKLLTLRRLINAHAVHLRWQ